MFTRGRLVRHRWGRAGIGMGVPHVHGWRNGMVVGAGAVPLVLPPPVVMMDPSDRRTWTRPVRWS